VGAVIEQLDLDDITPVTYDFGGPAGLVAASRRPERVSQLAAVNCFAWPPEGPLFNGMLIGQYNDPLRFQRQWKRLNPNVHQLKVRRGNHFPMGDHRDLVASALSDFAKTDRNSGRRPV
jgi:pimeloyl-ACP methyl ester carboxylesterase